MISDDFHQTPRRVNWKNIFLLIIFVLIAAAVAAGSYFSQKKTTYKSKASERTMFSQNYLPSGSSPNIALSLNLGTGNTFPTYISLGAGGTSPFLGSGFTVEGWVNIPQYGNHSSSVLLFYSRNSQHNNNIFTLLFNEYAGDYKVYSAVLVTGQQNSSYLTVAPQTVFNYNTWNHIAVNGYTTSDGYCHLNVYINGVLSSENGVSNGGNCYFDYSNYGALYLGYRPNSVNNNYYKGYVDELRISRVIRYQQNFNPPYPELPVLDSDTTGLYHFNNNFLDGSVWGNNGSPLGYDYQFIPAQIGPTPTPTNPPVPTSTPFPTPTRSLTPPSFCKVGQTRPYYILIKDKCTRIDACGVSNCRQILPPN